MPHVPTTCPRCGGRMEQGFIMDFAHGALLVSQWAKGPPTKSFWTKTKKPKDGMLPVGTFRCSGCGFLESYARPEFAAQ